MQIKRLLALVLTLGPGLHAAGGPTSAQERTFFDSIDVQIINVEVFVRDAQGRPVRGLTREDFEILQDGEPVEITNFFAVDGVADAVAAGGPSGESNASPASAEFGGREPLHLLIFIDDLSLSPVARNRLIPEISDFIERRLEATQRVTVVSYDGSLDVLLPPTDQPEPVLEALEASMTRTARGAQAQLEMRGLLRELDRLDYATQDPRGAPSDSGSTLGSSNDVARRTYATVRQFAEQRHAETLRALDSVKQFVDSLTSLEGRKVVIFLSEGVSVSPGQDLLSAWERRFGNAAGGGLGRAADAVEFETGSLVREMAEYASSRRVTFYAIGGGGAGQSAGVRETGFTGNTAGAGGPSWSASFEAQSLDSRRESLTMLAQTTGGLAATGLDGARATLARLSEDLADCYSLAYTPRQERDGELHRVEVCVKNLDNVVVRHRERYRAKTVDDEMRDRTRSALLLGAESNPLGVSLAFGDEEPIGGDYRVPVIVKIPIGRIVLLPQEAHHHGKLSIFLGTRDEKGRTSEIFKSEVPIRIPNEQVFSVLSRVGGFGMNLSMRSGRHRIAVTVRDEIGKSQSVTTAEFEPGRLEVDLGEGTAAAR